METVILGLNLKLLVEELSKEKARYQDKYKVKFDEACQHIKILKYY